MREMGIMELDRAGKARVYERCLEEIIGKAKGRTIRERMEIVCKVLEENLPYYFWVGFYLPKGDYLELGPSIGPPACAEIPLTGVCGKTAKKKRPIIVPDVTTFPGHITCDPRSRSEIALPVFDAAGKVIAVFDVDSEGFGSFDQIDRKWLEMILGDVFS